MSKDKEAAGETKVSSLVELVDEAVKLAAVHCKATPMVELNRVRIKLQICKDILSHLPAEVLSG